MSGTSGATEDAQRLFRATASASEAVAAILAEALEDAVEPEAAVVGRTNEAGGVWTVEAYYIHRPDADRLGGLIRTAAARHGLAPPPVRIQPVEDRDWVRESHDSLHPISAGRFMLYGSHDRDRYSPGKVNLEIDAGRAFGSGHHATTLGCLLALDRISKTFRPRTVFDLGCGSGVLAISAAKRIGTAVLAVDTDPVATGVTKRNAVMNAAAPLIRPVTASGLGHKAIRDRAPFDLVLANILAGPLIGLAPGLSRIVAPGGHVVLSGLLRRQEARVFAAYRIQGFVMENRIRIGEWPTLILRLRGQRVSRPFHTML